ncbi:FAD-dependent oxidoreductase [Candidatus Marithrix sp. Canyon 246]|uniref:FAD-dependent oxidoreductase n=1 Tax=Candidatus Marithrix sp. Canyon 246 TaxID=1827136 RepID=UPI000849F7D2|nr:FAD-dependent oxidoreductase [Candidatus Marithrix sp. Canyon 246]
MSKNLVIGGGFYGCLVALELNKHGHQVILVESENDFMQRASYINQARIHQGYHYPRSFLTALRSRQNFTHFVKEFPECVDNSFDKYYAIAHQSKVSAVQFYKFCQRIGAPVSEAPDDIKKLFNRHLINDVFKVKEYAFDAVILKEIIATKLAKTDIDIRLNSTVIHIEKDVVVIQEGQNQKTITVDRIFNCTYSNLNRLIVDAKLEMIPLKHEYTEMALIEVPDPLKKVGITVMDGPFFSCMPFPSRKLHSLSHVRYTPHYHWVDREEKEYIHKSDSLYTAMIRDAARYLPLLMNSNYIESLWEIKTVLPQSEGDDSRPILFKESEKAPGVFSVMGGKIDNIIDIREQVQKVI